MTSLWSGRDLLATLIRLYLLNPPNEWAAEFVSTCCIMVGDA
jgi:hypothetical protein